MLIDMIMILFAESQFHWWKSLLSLMLDDDATVRRNANLIISKVRSLDVQCGESMLEDFFEIFVESIGKKEPNLCKLFLFAWGFGFACDIRNIDCEETDVRIKVIELYYAVYWICE